MHPLFYIMLWIALAVNGAIWGFQSAIWRRLVHHHPSTAISLGISDRFWASPLVRVKITRLVWAHNLDSLHDSSLSSLSRWCLRLWTANFVVVLLVFVTGVASVLAR